MADQGWDQGQTIYLADSQQPQELQADSTVIQKKQAEDAFYEFLRNFRADDDTFLYRDTLRNQYNSGNYVLNVYIRHLRANNEILANYLRERPGEYLPCFEKAVYRAVDEMTKPRPNNAPVKPVQVTIQSDQNPLLIRDLDSQYISKLVKVPGIIINASTVRAKATKLHIECSKCNDSREIALKAGFSGQTLPRTCQRANSELDEDKCPLDPYQIIGDKCSLVDQQTLKLQENPESVPTGELPRHIVLSVDRNLVNYAVAGTRVTAIGIYDVFSAGGGTGKKDKVGAQTKVPYVRVVGFMQEDNDMNVNSISYTSEEEAKFIELSRDPNIYERIATSISPAVLGSKDIKKAIACLLFGGSRKQLPDGMRLRGDINVLLLGDPGTAKSQLLKFVEKMAPVAVYTSGKGSSAAGLTASVIRDSQSREFYLEAGAMVLADGGVACIDEFDKMRETDRVAIHEAMEQQTISIAKAGITTILNSRTSVLAAANSTFGRWDDTQDQESNIDFQATVLSRFDTIFIIKDLHDEVQDTNIAKHVIGFHKRSTAVGIGQTIFPNAAATTNSSSNTSGNNNNLNKDGTDSSAATTDSTHGIEGFVAPELLKKYIHYARKACGPRLHQEAKERLVNEFVSIRQLTKNTKSAIPITVRQLEAIVRLSESICKMRLGKFATISDVEEALRLFRCSTLEAASNGDLNAAGEMQSDENNEATREVVKRIQRRFFIGAHVRESVIVEDFKLQGYPEHVVRKALWVMLKRGDLEHRYQRKVLHRVR